MQLDASDPDHVRLHEVRSGRWLLLLLALGATIAVGICWAPLALPRPFAVVAVLALLIAFATLVTLRFRRTIDIGRDLVRYERRQLFGADVHEGPRAALRHVTLRGRIVVTQAGDATFELMQFDVALISAHDALPPSIPLRSGAREQATRRFAEAVCRALQLPLHDLLGEALDVRSVAGFGRGPTFRQPMPADTPPPGIVLHVHANGHPVVSARALPRSRLLLATLVVLAALLGVVVVGAFVTPGSGARSTILWWFPALVTASLLLVLAWLCFGRVELFVADGELHCVSRLFGRVIGHRCVPVAAIERVHPRTPPGVAIVTDRTTLLVGPGLGADGRQWLAAWLQSQLWPQLPIVRGG